MTVISVHFRLESLRNGLATLSDRVKVHIDSYGCESRPTGRIEFRENELVAANQDPSRQKPANEPRQGTLSTAENSRRVERPSAIA